MQSDTGASFLRHVLPATIFGGVGTALAAMVFPIAVPLAAAVALGAAGFGVIRAGSCTGFSAELKVKLARYTVTNRQRQQPAVAVLAKRVEEARTAIEHLPRRAGALPSPYL